SNPGFAGCRNEVGRQCPTPWRATACRKALAAQAVAPHCRSGALWCRVRPWLPPPRAEAKRVGGAASAGRREARTIPLGKSFSEQRLRVARPTSGRIRYSRTEGVLAGEGLARTCCD